MTFVSLAARSGSLLLSLVAMVLLSRCQNGMASETIQIAVEQTLAAEPMVHPSPTGVPTASPTPSPTAMPTAEPITASQIESRLFVQNDLPSKFVGQQVDSNLARRLHPIDVGDSILTVHQEFADGKWYLGDVEVLVYDSAESAVAAYDRITVIMQQNGRRALYDIEAGDSGVFTQDRDAGTTRVLSRQCKAIVHIDLRDREQDLAINYARRLTERLKQVVCR